MRIRVLGIGNPILSDDGVGIKIARRIKLEKPELNVIETYEGGLSLIDYIVDCDKLIIIDSIKTGQGEPGELFEIELKDLRAPMGFANSHGIDLAAAFDVGRGLGYQMPGVVSIYAVNVKDNSSFGEECSADIEREVTYIARQVIGKEKL